MGRYERRDRAAQRPLLDRDLIIRAATGLIERQGLARFTMRRLGAVLGFEAMTLYRYVPSRDAVIDGVADNLIDDLLDANTVQIRPPHWQAYLQELAHAVRRLALAHPQVFPTVATHPPSAPWLRPPLRSLRFVESFLSSLQACGFSDDALVFTYRAFSTFLLGHLLLEVHTSEGMLTETSTDPVAPELYPHLTRLAPALTGDHGQQEFEEALESLLDRIAITIF